MLTWRVSGHGELTRLIELKPFVCNVAGAKRIDVDDVCDRQKS
jgi:hypothetical protein